MTQTLDDLDDDALVIIFAALTIPDIQAFRQVCRRLWFMSLQYIVWLNAYKIHIVQEHIPFPSGSLNSLSATELERQTLRAYRLGQNWRSPNIQLHLFRTAGTSSIGAIEEIKFVVKNGKNWIVTISLGIWTNLCLWDCATLQIVNQWNPGKAIFNGMAINTVESSDATVAISVKYSSYTAVELLSLGFEDSTSSVSLRQIATLQTAYKPIALRGDIVSLSDHDSETIIMNWKTGDQCLLRSPETWQDNPLHVTSVAGNTIVVRARSVSVFEEPPFMASPSQEVLVNFPHKSISFGWVDGVSLSERPVLQCAEEPRAVSLSMLVRTKGDDPWALQDQFQLYTVHSGAGEERADPLEEEIRYSHAPPPTLTLTTSISCPNRGPLRCTDIVLGRYGTAVWVLPADRSAAGLISEHIHLQPVPVPASNQTLTIVSFPGPLHCGGDEAEVRVSVDNEDGSSWSCMDYDEERGLIALGSSAGGITLFSL